MHCTSTQGIRNNYTRVHENVNSFSLFPADSSPRPWRRGSTGVQVWRGGGQRERQWSSPGLRRARHTHRHTAWPSTAQTARDWKDGQNCINEDTFSNGIYTFSHPKKYTFSHPKYTPIIWGENGCIYCLKKCPQFKGIAIEGFHCSKHYVHTQSIDTMRGYLCICTHTVKLRV